MFEYIYVLEIRQVQPLFAMNFKIRKFNNW